MVEVHLLFFGAALGAAFVFAVWWACEDLEGADRTLALTLSTGVFLTVLIVVRIAATDLDPITPRSFPSGSLVGEAEGEL